MKLSIVIPVHNEEETLAYTLAQIDGVFKKELVNQFDDGVDLVIVDDGSTDGSLAIVEEHQRNAMRSCEIRTIQLSRNFGHSGAVLAGIDHADGDVIAIIDADLQDPPELIPGMCQKITEGFDVVYGQRISRRGESVFKRLSAWLFYRILSALTGVAIPKDSGDFRVFTKEVKEALEKCREQTPFLRGLIAWLGFKQLAFPYERRERKFGNTKYPFIKMLKFALMAILSFSSVPLKLTIYLGGMGMFISLILMSWVFMSGLKGNTVPGWASTLTGYSLGQSITLLLVGVIGMYIERIYVEVQNRPRYIVRKKIVKPMVKPKNE